MKTKINITIDPFVLEQAKEKGINISETAERAVVNKLNPENPIDTTGDHCEYCGTKMKKATANDMNGLYYFLPDEKWICPRCEKKFINKLIMSKSL
ncbi:MAG: type II toxin-antitoxin system CcdA family antitoxin [Clostridia bacterium]|nr:type II toxin-antitoxin system CcdA family antitoxin [Clostridia bacterium]